MNKLVDWKNRLKDRHMLSVVVVLFAIIIAMGIWIYKKQVDYRQASENQYNMAFYELVNYVQDVETYLAKSLISSTSEHGAETLTNVWKEANLAQVYLSRLPIESVELENTAKFLNQVSDYSFSLSRKNIKNERNNKFMGEFILETKNLSKQYGQQMAVDGISLKIRENTVYGLLGPNGAGKSTTLKMLVGLIRPTNGQIMFDGKKWNRNCLTRMGALIETPSLYGNLTAEENLLVHTELLGIPKKKIRDVLEIVDLTDTGKKRAAQFSMGMKQRLGIAIALLNDPCLLILDEPTNGLDPFGIQELRKLISSFPQKGITVILSSHILSEVAQVVDDIGILSNGRLLYEGSVDPDENLEKFFNDIIIAGGKM